MEDSTHWSVYVLALSDHMELCGTCKNANNHVLNECLEFILLSGKVDRTFKRWMASEYGK